MKTSRSLFLSSIFDWKFIRSKFKRLINIWRSVGWYQISPDLHYVRHHSEPMVTMFISAQNKGLDYWNFNWVGETSENKWQTRLSISPVDQLVPFEMKQYTAIDRDPHSFVLNDIKRACSRNEPDVFAYGRTQKFFASVYLLVMLLLLCCPCPFWGSR